MIHFVAGGKFDVSAFLIRLSATMRFIFAICCLRAFNRSVWLSNLVGGQTRRGALKRPVRKWQVRRSGCVLDSFTGIV